MSIKKNNFIGKELIKFLSSQIPTNSGIYKMIDIKNKIIYIGKAKNLKNRVLSYANSNLTPRIEHMVSQIHFIEWIITSSEQDALLLESDLIKQFQPKYNILLKDDKTFPFIKLSLDHKYPRIFKFRSKTSTAIDGVFGPFASSEVVDDNIKIAQSLFKIRSCSDNVFSHRQRACILYQIKRCSAPCVNKINDFDYKDSINQLVKFLKGDNQELKKQLSIQLEFLKKNQNYEQAIVIRDRIKNLNELTNKQSILLDKNQNADFIALVKNSNQYLGQIFLFRNGRHYGALDVAFEEKIDEDINNVWQKFLLHFYTHRDCPQSVYINYNINKSNSLDFKLLENVLKKANNKKITIKNPNTPIDKNIMDIVIRNGRESLEKKHLKQSKWKHNFDQLQTLFKLSNPINVIEIYDNSHLYGTLSLGVMVSATHSGFAKENYRIFHLKNKNIMGNDDYGILKEVFTRRLSKIVENKDIQPDLILIDGGVGQLQVAYKVMCDLKLNIPMVGVAKGAKRNAGEEKLILIDNSQINLDKYSSDLHFIQMLRNEAHRFAIQSLKKRISTNLVKSELDDIPQIGLKRKKDLLNYFGSLDNIKKASIKDLLKVPNINNAVAIKIFNWFH